MTSRTAIATVAAAAVGLTTWLLWKANRHFRPQVLDPTNPEHLRWIRSIDTFIFDIDGVLYTGSGPIDGASEAIRALKRSGKKVRYLTNNSAKSVEAVVATFAKMGILADASEITNSALVAAEYLKVKVGAGSKVYVIGETSLFETLRRVGEVECIGGVDENNKGKIEWMAEKLTLETLKPPADEVKAVVIGSESTVNYYKLTKAGAYLRANPSCKFIGTNPDPVFTLAKGTRPRDQPTLGIGAGVWIDAVSTIGGRRPEVICGKPSVSLGQFMIERYGFDPRTTCMVGDRLDTDIEFGRSIGLSTLFVESGTMSREDAMNPNNGPLRTPAFVAPSIATLGDVLRRATAERTGASGV